MNLDPLIFAKTFLVEDKYQVLLTWQLDEEAEDEQIGKSFDEIPDEELCDHVLIAKTYARGIWSTLKWNFANKEHCLLAFEEYDQQQATHIVNLAKSASGRKTD